MNKNSVIGIILILGVLVGWSVWMTPSKEEMARQQHVRDSIRLVQKANYIADSIARAQAATADVEDTASIQSAEDKMLALRNEYGVFATAADGEESRLTLENDVLKVTLSTLGGCVKRVQLKDYVTWDSLPLVGFDDSTAYFNLAFFSENRNINTAKLFFVPYLNGQPYSGNETIEVGDSLVFSMRLFAEDNPSKYLEYRYKMRRGEYMLDFDIVTHDFKNVISSNSSYINAQWYADILQQEKAVDRYNGSTVYYKFDKDDDVESLKEMEAADEESLRQRIKWISFKQRFFSYAIIAKDNFNAASIGMKTLTPKPNPRYLKTMYAEMEIPYNGLSSDNELNMSLYFGPNSLKVMDKYGIGLEKVIPLGGWFVSWINRYIVVNVFAWLGSYGWNYGIVILILTVIIKICLMPIAYKSYLSSAKMRVLKPEVDALNEKYPKQEDAMKKQRAVMDLYKKAGASPTAGCLPMLLQLPILWAIFRFFPSSIELRQQPFLWADDLSTYDSVLDLGFNIPFYGDHVSLFTLLMTAATIVYTYINNKTMAAAQGQSMPGMKLMMYAMPILFLGIFNNYSAGLSYYYFLVNIFTFFQMYLFKIFLDDNKLRAQIEKARLKPVKKSNFQKKLEEMQRKQQEQLKRR